MITLFFYTEPNKNPGPKIFGFSNKKKGFYLTFKLNISSSRLYKHGKGTDGFVS